MRTWRWSKDTKEGAKPVEIEGEERQYCLKTHWFFSSEYPFIGLILAIEFLYFSDSIFL